MIKVLGDVDWAKKVARQLKGTNISHDVIVIQLDRKNKSTGTFSSAEAVEKAISVLSDDQKIAVLVGSCPIQDYASNNPKTWAELPADRIFFYEAGLPRQSLAKFLKTL